MAPISRSGPRRPQRRSKRRPYLLGSTSSDRLSSSGCVVGTVHARSHGMQRSAATVWFRNVTIERTCLPLGQEIVTYRLGGEGGSGAIAIAHLGTSGEEPQHAMAQERCPHCSTAIRAFLKRSCSPGLLRSWKPTRPRRGRLDNDGNSPSSVLTGVVSLSRSAS